MVRKYIDTATAFTGLTSTQRVERIRDTLAEERAEYNDRLRTERLEALQADRDAKEIARQEAEQATIEADLRRRYNLALSKPVSDAEWEQVKDAVLHPHRLREMDRYDELVAETAARYRGML